MSVQKSTDSSSLAEVIDRILDKGIVIDAFVRVSLVGIEILTVEARVVIASVDTWLRYAEAVGLLSDEVQDEGLMNRKQSADAQFST
ncbi:gas vesicle protein GvpJ [Peribacillus deserti]|uniref:Gas vesicle protein A n=1 Tax=Peribacillus deserti TaxID=673318 RepID=A0A2N5M5N6_9BACI|nr:gas vesicle protein GvpJ [Peribacillus deserti]PLT29674.1 gas vesicle protein GvpA [Peribacillus deserti]